LESTARRVVVFRIMVEGNQLTYRGQLGEGNHVPGARVTPPTARWVLRCAVLRVVDKDVGIAGQINAGRPSGRVRELGYAQGGLLVGQVGKRSVPFRDPISDHWPGMSHEFGAHNEWADRRRCSRGVV